MAEGGRYEIDPETGRRKLVERTQPQPAPWEQRQRQPVRERQPKEKR